MELVRWTIIILAFNLIPYYEKEIHCSVVAILSCKKDKNNNNSALAGEWKLKYTHYGLVTDDNIVMQNLDVDNTRSGYIKFNTDGSGETNISEPIVTADGNYSDVYISGKFKYKTADNSLAISFNGNGNPQVRTWVLNGGNEMVISLTARAKQFALNGAKVPATATIIEHFSK